MNVEKIEKIERTSQLERIAVKLKEISVDVTSGDRDMLAQEHRYSKGTISSYLNGKGLDNETGTKIYLFLKARIDERENQIQNA